MYRYVTLRASQIRISRSKSIKMIFFYFFTGRGKYVTSILSLTEATSVVKCLMVFEA